MRTTFWFNDDDNAVRSVNSVYAPDAILYDGKLKISNNGVPFGTTTIRAIVILRAQEVQTFLKKQ